ncbi:RC-LH1 core complex protein PufX [Limimaricola sp.]|uniref:RC-LH1 core complex protein PufX n=1 Tax=Limimaricola sp. TaxID=2211665 RepID=UPI0025C442B3|nr:RC-LH1 core complex protein PufX [Limimaricola sp.]
MSEPDMMGLSDRTRLRADMTWLMLKGAGYAALLVFGVWLVIAVLELVGSVLPPDSKTAPDPTPTSMLEAPAALTQVG